MALSVPYAIKVPITSSPLTISFGDISSWAKLFSHTISSGLRNAYHLMTTLDIVSCIVL